VTQAESWFQTNQVLCDTAYHSKKSVCIQSLLALASNTSLVQWNPAYLHLILLLILLLFNMASLPTMAMQNLVHNLLPGRSDSTSASHVLLFFEIANMFNSVSHKSSWHDLEWTMPLLLPSFDMQYWEANLSWYKKLDGSLVHFEMNDGYPQGNALSSLLSCLTLHAVFSYLHKDLTIQAEWWIPIEWCTQSSPPSYWATHWCLHWWCYSTGSNKR
jgi:hypothetical protein